MELLKLVHVQQAPGMHELEGVPDALGVLVS
jgi:hypothetical protein